MRAGELPSYLRDLVLRMFPHRAARGLVPIGRPDRSSPVLLTGNFTLTVRRLRDALAGRDAWLLCADSGGINVWCAAGGGHLTHHDVIAAIRVSGIADRVDHRDLILPQLCATGVERRRVEEATGFHPRWGPARLEDLPEYLDRGMRVRSGQRFMRFPPWERMEMAAMWAIPTIAILTAIAYLVAGGAAAAGATTGVATLVFGLFALLPRLNVGGHARFATLGAGALVALAPAAAVVIAIAGAATLPLVVTAGATLVAALILAVDVAGTTPWYGSSINTAGNVAAVDLVEERCDGSADCVLVCPREVLAMDGPRRKVAIRKPEQCIQCGACVVQCPRDALRFRYSDGRVVEAATIRRTRMNMVGRRTIEVDPWASSGS